MPSETGRLVEFKEAFEIIERQERIIRSMKADGLVLLDIIRDSITTLQLGSGYFSLMEQRGQKLDEGQEKLREHFESAIIRINNELQRDRGG